MLKYHEQKNEQNISITDVSGCPNLPPYSNFMPLHCDFSTVYWFLQRMTPWFIQCFVLFFKIVVFFISLLTIFTNSPLKINVSSWSKYSFLNNSLPLRMTENAAHCYERSVMTVAGKHLSGWFCSVRLNGTKDTDTTHTCRRSQVKDWLHYFAFADSF